MIKTSKETLTVHPLDALSVTALLLFMVDSRNLPALKSQNSKVPTAVPMVRMFPLKDTDRMPPQFCLDEIFLTACNVLESNRSVCALLPTAYN